MHLIGFVSPSGEPTGHGLEPYVGKELGTLRPGDTVWLVTRMPDQRGTPALCGRIEVVRGGHGAEREGGRVAADAVTSERCDPFPCDTIRSWDVWRSPFGGIAPISDEQAACLRTFWAGTKGGRVRKGT